MKSKIESRKVTGGLCHLRCLMLHRASCELELSMDLGVVCCMNTERRLKAVSVSNAGYGWSMDALKRKASTRPMLQFISFWVAGSCVNLVGFPCRHVLQPLVCHPVCSGLGPFTGSSTFELVGRNLAWKQRRCGYDRPTGWWQSGRA